jgi:hypothetical protein
MPARAYPSSFRFVGPARTGRPDLTDELVEAAA